MSIAMRFDIPINSTFILLCCSQIFLFMFEFISLIFIYNNLKIQSEECSLILHRMNMLAPPRDMIEIACTIEVWWS